ncbi:MAG: hypothetical protein RL153_1541 [Verrucomicrobiota bacterium]|jgi:hypothetical protein
MAEGDEGMKKGAGHEPGPRATRRADPWISVREGVA